MNKIKPIEYDADMDRFYIPVNSRYEIQTKGKGSSFRITNTETHIRVIVLNDSLHHVLEDTAKATNAEMMQLQAKLSQAEAEKAELVYFIKDLPRYSFLSPSEGGVRRFKDKSGTWVEYHEVIKLLGDGA
jgi:hypothetical protein